MRAYFAKGSRTMTSSLATAFTIIALVATFGARANAADLPAISFPGHSNIGADLNAYKPPASVIQIVGVRADRYDRLYFPGDAVSLKVTLRNTSTDKVVADGTWRTAWIHDAPGDDRGGIRYTYGDELPPERLAPITIAAGAEAVVTLTREAPDRYGTLGLFVETSEVVQWVTNYAVIHRLTRGPMPDSMFLADARALRLWQRELEVPVMERLGVRWVRFGESMGSVVPKPGQYDFKELDAMVDQHRRAGILSVYMGGFAPDWTRPHGRLSWPRGNPAKQDASPAPQFYDDWAEYFRQVVARHKDNIRAVNVWNEPYEGGGISDWGGTGEHLRGLMRAMHRGAKAADPTVLRGGGDSDGNVVDNLLTDPDWQSYVDLLTVHGFGTPGQVVHAMRPKGVALWNTETWYTSFSDKLVQWQLMERARGCEKVSVLILGNVFTSGYRSGGRYDPKDPANVPDLVPQPAAVAYNTMAYQLEGMRFVGEGSPNHLPYTMLFERSIPTTASYKAAMVLFGQAASPSESEWPQLRAGIGEAEVRDLPAGVTGVFDQHGNAIAPRDGVTRVPFDTRPVYVTGDNVDALRAFTAALKVVKYDRPVQIGVIDPTAADLNGATMALRVTNPLPHELDVNLSIACDEWSFETSTISVALKAGETKDLPVRIANAGPLPNGRADLKVSVTTPLGNFTLNEPIEHRVIRRFTPTLDATFDDWRAAGIAPVVLTRSTGPNAALAAAMPWEQLTTGEAVAGRYALAHDDAFLYVLADIRAPKRDERPWDQSRDDWFGLHPGGYAYKTAPQWPFSGENVQVAIDAVPNPQHLSHGADDARSRRYAQRQADYLFGFYETRQGAPQAWLYRTPSEAMLPLHRYPFSPIDPHSNRLMTDAKVVVQYDEAAKSTRYEIAIPWSAVPEVKPQSGATIAGLELKLTMSRWNGLLSATGRGAAKADQSVFQPHWASGTTADIPWRLE